MNAQDKDNGFVADCTVTPTENGYQIAGSFRSLLTINVDDNELDQIEKQVEQIGQQLKRQLCQNALETADAQYVQLITKTQSHLRKHGKGLFTIILKCGRIKLRRQRMLNSQTGKTMIPSAIFWETSQNRHVSRQAIEAACDASQDVSYRKAARQLTAQSGEEQLICASTVWHQKQAKGKELEQKQNDFAEKILTQKCVTSPEQGVAPPGGVPSASGTRRIEEKTIQLQMDETLTKSQEPGKKTNVTYTATLQTTEGTCYYLAAKSHQELIRQVLAHFVALGLYLGKRLEVVSDGARWIGDWVDGLSEVEVTHVLCWYHLSRRVYEGLSGLGVSQEQRKLLEREILGHLWHGRTAQAIWILWGLRPSARTVKRIDYLMGYLLRKKGRIVNYDDRRQHELWLASTRVEKWNDLAITDRCKHRGMSWTSQGVLAVALYAAQQKQNAQTTAQNAQINSENHTSL